MYYYFNCSNNIIEIINTNALRSYESLVMENKVKCENDIPTLYYDGYEIENHNKRKKIKIKNKNKFTEFLLKIDKKYRKYLVIEDSYIRRLCGRKSKDIHVGHWNFHFLQKDHSKCIFHTKLKLIRNYTDEINEFLHKVCIADYNTRIKKYEYLLRTSNTKLNLYLNYCHRYIAGISYSYFIRLLPEYLKTNHSIKHCVCPICNDIRGNNEIK